MIKHLIILTASLVAFGCSHTSKTNHVHNNHNKHLQSNHSVEDHRSEGTQASAMNASEEEAFKNESIEDHRSEGTQATAMNNIDSRLPAAASYSGDSGLKFSNSEKRSHARKSADMKRIAGDCLRAHREEHVSFFKSHCRGGKCLSKYYGNRRYSASKDAERSDGKGLTYLPDAVEAAGFPRKWASQMESISCVDLALKCLGRGFKETGQGDLWSRLRKFTIRNGTGGTALQHGLQKLGWKVHYWTPYSDTAGLQQWVDKEEKGHLRTDVGPKVRACSPRTRAYPNGARYAIERDGQIWCPWESRGYHVHNFRMATKRGRYYKNKIDDATSLVGFGKTTPRVLIDTEFWVGTANGGYHVFPGTGDQVVEAHSTRAITSIDTFEFSRFSPLASGGGPRWSNHEKYVSGMIAIPPR